MKWTFKKTKWSIIIIIVLLLLIITGITFACVALLKSSWWNDVIVPSKQIVTLIFFGVISFFVAIKKWKLWIKFFILAVLLALSSKATGINLGDILKQEEYQIVIGIFFLISTGILIIKKVKKQQENYPETEVNSRNKKEERKKIEPGEEEVSNTSVLIIFIVFITMIIFSIMGVISIFKNNKTSTVCNVISVTDNNIYRHSDFSKKIEVVSKGTFIVSEQGFDAVLPVPDEINIIKSGDNLFINFSSKFVYKIQRKEVDPYPFLSENGFILDPRAWSENAKLKESIIFTKYGKIEIPNGTDVVIGHKPKSRTLQISFCIKK